MERNNQQRGYCDWIQPDRILQYTFWLAILVSQQATAWDRNIELFVSPTTDRTLFGGQLLQPLSQDNNSLTYLDFRGVYNPGQTNEFNIGLGFRRILDSRNWYLGGYGAFDTRESDSGRRYNQATLGVEAISADWDLRANGYLPLTGKKLISATSGGPVGAAYFSGFNLIQPYVQGTQIYEEALAGMDVEVGRLLPFIPYGETRLYLGSYYFDGDSVASTGMGLRGRLEFRPRKNLIFGVSTQHDDLFGAETAVTLKYSFGYKSERGNRTLSERMIQIVERDIDVAETSQLPALDRTLNIPTDPTEMEVSANVVHIDNMAMAGGDGSFERRFNSIGACKVAYGGAYCGDDAEDSVIYIHAGDGTTTGLDQTIVLQNNQKLIGQGYEFMGIGGDRFPVLQASADIQDLTYDLSVVNLANNNEVAGLHILGHQQAIPSDPFPPSLIKFGIYGRNITDFNIHDNEIDRVVAIQVTADESTGSLGSSGIIMDNFIRGISLNNSASGAVISATQSVILSGNTVSDNSFGLLARNESSYNGTAIQTVDLSRGDNKFTNNFRGATFSNAAGVFPQVATLCPDDNYLSTSFCGGNLPPPHNTGGIATQTILMNGANNQFNDNNFGGSVFSNTSPCCVGIDDLETTATQIVDLSDGANQFNDNGKELYGGPAFATSQPPHGALFINNVSLGVDSNQIVNLKNGANEFNNNFRDGLEIETFVSGSGTGISHSDQIIDLSGGNNRFDNNQRNGVRITTDIWGLYSQEYMDVNQAVTLTGNNHVRNNGEYGVYISNDAAVQTVDLSGSDLSGNGSGEYFAKNISGSQIITPP